VKAVDLDQKYYNMRVEPLLNSPQMKEIQWKKLKQSVRFFYDHVPFDRERMQKSGAVPEDIRSFEDFAIMIPISGQAEYRAVYERCTVGENACLDMDMALEILFGAERLKNLYLMTTTSGTTGMPTPYPVFHQTTELMPELFGRIGWRAGLRPGTRLAVCFGLSMHVAGVPHLFFYKKLPEVSLFPIGAESGTERMLNLIKLFRVNAFAGTPSLALHLIERAPEVLKAPIKSLGIKVLMLGAEPGAGIPEIRRRLETEYGAKVYDVGAGYGCSCDYPEYQGMHWIADDYCYYELVNPETHEPVPMEHGAIGLGVFTPLDPLSTFFFANLRFTMNDIHQVFTEPCPCGLSGFRYKIVGRADDMLKIKGVTVYPDAIQRVIAQFVPRVTGAFRIVLEEPPPRVVPPLKLKIEYGEGVQDAELTALAKEIEMKMHSTLKIRPSITWLATNTLPRAAKKTRLLEKAYTESG
jgi:phenylacetate-CoA ligase